MVGNKNENVCCAAPTLVFACSGAADVGAISDRAARTLTAEGAGISEFDHMKVTDFGLEKGKSPATDENIAAVVQAALIRLKD